ncbi:CHAD domain-containing protein [Candidatus Chloroploca sp. M-50]|uniref:CHAD domain-containing protein n=1 Tax=Candidatus Chloroploca mongolica TaxID=2528176 RepID=A0ABS4D6Z2_9CHLR|nr:CHAD domain-containing protein [Candidatus Chloroploca mongolica]MBP1465175.1 CHAD domain-containing protein [Candidatus Chloroploca mongolica]
MSIDELLTTYYVDQAHARRVADLSLALFDATAEQYSLNPDRRYLLEVGALLHNVGLTTNPADHHLVGRDLVLGQLTDGFAQRERAIVAAQVAFHRKKVRPQVEPAYLALGNKARAEALHYAALLRVADGLDNSQSQTTVLHAVSRTTSGFCLHLAGPYAQEDGERAIAKADLWTRVFGESLDMVVENAGDEAPHGFQWAEEAAQPEPAQALDAPIAQPDDPEASETGLLEPWYAQATTPLAELGRVLLRRQLRRMLLAERDVRADTDIEAVHALRVATRRLRAILRLLDPVYSGTDLRKYSKGIGRIAREASAVRDRDVLLDDLTRRAASLPSELQPGLATLIERLGSERKAAYAALIKHLNRDDHAAFVQRCARMMNDHAQWDDQPRVCDLGGSTIWRHYEALRAYDRGGLPAEIAQLHMMRIEGKRMRYVLELFSDTLGECAETAVNALVGFQDHLGELNDLDVARALLVPHRRDATTGAAVAAYMTLREEHGHQLIAELPERWAQLNSPAYRQILVDLMLNL